ncbi:MAG: hypothetical protein E7299_04795 [Lachnospiraceae bacterium]|nr:hypothetical protein [Lachnospiraceae bacterium]
MIEVPTRVKEALEDGSYLKNYRFIILDENGEEEFTIDNNNLVSESVSIDERLCSEDTIKFGLCEGCQLQFEYFGFPDIRGRRIHAYIDVQYKEKDGSLQWHSISLGFFEVRECAMQFSTGIRKCSCYNKLYSEYLDAKADELVKELVNAGECGVTNKLSVHTLLKMLLQGYSIEEVFEEETEYSAAISGRSYNKIAVPVAYADGTTTGGYYYIHTVNGYIIPKGFSEDDFFSFRIYAKQIRQKLKDKGIVSASRYTIANGEVYSFEEYAKTNFNGARAVGGGADIISTSGEKILELKFGKAEEDVITDYITNIRKGVSITIPVKVTGGNSSDPDITEAERETMNNLYEQFISEVNVVDCTHKILAPIEKYRLTSAVMEELSDITIRKLQSAVYETRCLFGRLDRITDLFSGVELNNKRLLPAQILYPERDLYPKGLSIRAKKSTFQQLWVENDNVKKFRYLIVTYKTVDAEGAEIEKVLQRTINNDGNTDYHMSDNWLFKNFVWTEEEVGIYADNMIEKMQNMTWFPFEMWCVGLPFLETGDEIEIPTDNGTYTTYILQRQMKGIQSLADSYINGTLNIF